MGRTEGVESLIAAARKFIEKCETGKAHSIVTYSEMKAALAEIDRAESILKND